MRLLWCLLSVAFATEAEWFKEMLRLHNALRQSPQNPGNNLAPVSEKDIQDLRTLREANGAVDKTIEGPPMPPLPTLCLSSKYDQQAKEHAERLAVNVAQLTAPNSSLNPHTLGGNPGERYKQPGEQSAYVTESIAYCSGNDCNVAKIFELLRDLPPKEASQRGHYSNILTAVMTSVSMGQAKLPGKEEWWWVLVYSKEPCVDQSIGRAVVNQVANVGQAVVDQGKAATEAVSTQINNAGQTVSNAVTTAKTVVLDKIDNKVKELAHLFENLGRRQQ